MKAVLKKMILGSAALVLIGAGQAFGSPTPTATSTNPSPYFSERASTLLNEIQTETAEMRLHAETLGTFARRPQMHWQSHAFHLNRVKGHMNKVGERLAELQQISDFVQPWQRKAIDQVTSHAAEIASSTQAAIVHLRVNQSRFFVPEYRNHLINVADRSDDMKETVDKYLDYEKTQNAFQRLQNELELARN
jgi:hypothetical protein